jgi:hypothetical protein
VLPYGSSLGPRPPPHTRGFRRIDRSILIDANGELKRSGPHVVRAKGYKASIAAPPERAVIAARPGDTAQQADKAKRPYYYSTDLRPGTRTGGREDHPLPKKNHLDGRRPPPAISSVRFSLTAPCSTLLARVPAPTAGAHPPERSRLPMLSCRPAVFDSCRLSPTTGPSHSLRDPPLGENTLIRATTSATPLDARPRRCRWPLPTAP